MTVMQMPELVAPETQARGSGDPAAFVVDPGDPQAWRAQLFRSIDSDSAAGMPPASQASAMGLDSGKGALPALPLLPLAGTLTRACAAHSDMRQCRPPSLCTACCSDPPCRETPVVQSSSRGSIISGSSQCTADTGCFDTRNTTRCLQQPAQAR